MQLVSTEIPYGRHDDQALVDLHAQYAGYHTSYFRPSFQQPHFLATRPSNFGCSWAALPSTSHLPHSRYQLRQQPFHNNYNSAASCHSLPHPSSQINFQNFYQNTTLPQQQQPFFINQSILQNMTLQQSTHPSLHTHFQTSLAALSQQQTLQNPQGYTHSSYAQNGSHTSPPPSFPQNIAFAPNLFANDHQNRFQSMSLAPPTSQTNFHDHNLSKFSHTNFENCYAHPPHAHQSMLANCVTCQSTHTLSPPSNLTSPPSTQQTNSQNSKSTPPQPILKTKFQNSEASNQENNFLDNRNFPSPPPPPPHPHPPFSPPPTTTRPNSQNMEASHSANTCQNFDFTPTSPHLSTNATHIQNYPSHHSTTNLHFQNPSSNPNFQNNTQNFAPSSQRQSVDVVPTYADSHIHSQSGMPSSSYSNSQRRSQSAATSNSQRRSQSVATTSSPSLANSQRRSQNVTAPPASTNGSVSPSRRGNSFQGSVRRSSVQSSRSTTTTSPARGGFWTDCRPLEVLQQKERRKSLTSCLYPTSSSAWHSKNREAALFRPAWVEDPFDTTVSDLKNLHY